MVGTILYPLAVGTLHQPELARGLNRRRLHDVTIVAENRDEMATTHTGSRESEIRSPAHLCDLAQCEHKGEDGAHDLEQW